MASSAEFVVRNAGHDDVEAIRLLTTNGWRITNGLRLSTNIFSYRDYIVGSRGEFTVAKDQYARLRSGCAACAG